MKRLVIAAALLVCFVSASVAAQEFRGAITGRVADASGGRLPGVTVTATNTATNVAATTTTNREGEFSFPLLNPGTYTVTAELSGFRKLIRQGIEVRVADRMGLDLALEVGNMTETVSVVADSPLLETQTGSTGQVIDQKTISMMPLSDGNPFVLTRLAPGIAYNGDLKFSRPFDNGGTSGIVTAGATGGNEFTLDGSPNMASGRRVAFVPPSDAVQQFKVETASFDAAAGHTGGATVNVTLKSGTNTFRGSGYTYFRSEKLAETDFFLKRAQEEKPKLGYKRPGATIGGPIVANRTFFFFAVEWLYDRFPEPITSTVPTEAMRRGDFSALLPLGIQIYNPYSAQTVGARVVRQPFAGNIIPNELLNPIARNVLNYFPAPNQPGNASLQDNFIYENPRTDRFDSESFRVDHMISSTQRLGGRYTRNSRRESRNAQLGTVNGVVPNGNFLFRNNDGVTVDYTDTRSASSVWDIRAGWQRFQEPNVRQHENVFDPASLGFSPSVVSLFGGAQYFPFFGFDTIHDIGDNLGGNTTHTIYSVQPTYTKLWGNHSIRAGYDMRLYHEFSANAGRQAGEYTQTNGGAFTRQQDNTAAQNFQDVATFLLGVPTGGNIDLNGTRTNDSWYHGFYVQDDWKITPRLTLNLGLRYEYESATTEMDNRNVRGFDPAAMLSITTAAEAAYAARPDVVPASQWHARGGLQFASDGNPAFWDADAANLMPRAGFAYRLNDLTVLRGGTGVYMVPYIINGVQQNGFSQVTPFVATQDRGLTFQSTLNNPYPLGVLQPAGNTLGPNTFLGQSPGRFMPIEAKNQKMVRYQVTVQRELPKQWLLEVGYVGSHGYNLTTDRDLNPVPAQYLSTSQSRDQAAIDFLGTQVPNPFVGLLPTGFTGANVARSQLLRPFPQFSGVSSQNTDGTSQYDSAQISLQKRYTHGYSIITTYTRAHYTERVFLLNATDTTYEKRLARDDVPHRFTAGILFELPFGRGKKWGGDAGGTLNAIIGGWSINAIGQLQSGRPLDFGGRNIYFDGDLNALEAKYTDDPARPAWDLSGFYFHDAAVQTNGVDDPVKQRADQRIRLASNIRYFPSRVDGIRSPFLNLWDISLVKQVPLAGRARMQFNIEFLNAFNRVVYNDANTLPTDAAFGTVTSQNNLPRDIQLAAKIVW